MANTTKGQKRIAMSKLTPPPLFFLGIRSQRRQRLRRLPCEKTARSVKGETTHLRGRFLFIVTHRYLGKSMVL